MLASYPASILNQITRRVGKQIRFSLNASRSSLVADLLGIRARGFSVDDEERNLGMRCVAAPVFNEFGEPVGGVSISGPTVRMNDAKIAAMGPRVHEAARALTLAMGGSFPPASAGGHAA